MSVEQLNHSDDQAGDPDGDLFARIQRLKHTVPIVEDEVRLHANSTRWPLWRNFLAGLRDAVDYMPPDATGMARTPKEKARTTENIAFKTEAGVVLHHMADGTFWEKPIGKKKATDLMDPADLINARNKAAHYVERYKIERPVPPSSPAREEPDGDETRVIRIGDVETGRLNANFIREAVGLPPRTGMTEPEFFGIGDEPTFVVGAGVLYAQRDDGITTQRIGTYDVPSNDGVSTQFIHPLGTFNGEDTLVLRAPDPTGFEEERFGLSQDPTRPLPPTDPEMTQPWSTDPSSSEHTVAVTGGWELAWPPQSPYQGS